MLEIKNLRVFFEKEGKRTDAVRGASLDVPENSFTGIVGGSGSGKTVTVLSIARLLPAANTSGKVLWKTDGKAADLLLLSEKELRNFRGRQIAYVFQDPSSSFDPLVRVGEQVREAFTAHFSASKEASRREALAQLEAVRLKDPERVYGSFPHELSGGMKQRAMIAMALVTRPRLLIADEPTSALDHKAGAGIMKLLKGLQASRKLSVLFITHDLSLASGACDALYVMSGGKVIERCSRTPKGFQMKSEYGRALFRASLVGVKPKTYIEV